MNAGARKSSKKKSKTHRQHAASRAVEAKTRTSKGCNNNRQPQAKAGTSSNQKRQQAGGGDRWARWVRHECV